MRGHQIESNAWEEKNDERSRHDDLLKHYVSFLRNCDAETFGISLAAASSKYATPAVWSRIFGVGSERVADVGDLIWPLIERPDFLENGVTLRDAVRFITAAWSSRAPKARIKFETMALDETRFKNQDDLGRWHRILGRIFKIVPEEELESMAMRALHRKLVASGLLIENNPLFRLTVSGGDHGVSGVGTMYRIDGENEPGFDTQLLAASESLFARVRRTTSDNPGSDLAALWGEAMALLALLEAHPTLSDRDECAAWGHISNAVERVALSPNYVPGTDSLPDLAIMFSVLDRLSASRYPELHGPLC